ncbi:MAG TPA: PEP-CTERM sorting domain-containing protein [Candidatus Saccharimonadales bacterium]|nr:PEP-CTERM sorting domain-containing protein [Candidatus Saccharimonadales bacterium]
MNKTPKLTSLRFTLAVAAGLAASTMTGHAQGINASATLTDVPGAGGTFTYTLTLNNASSATTPIQGFWYAWIPGHFFLPTVPSSASGGLSGWSATVSSGSIMYQGTAANAIAPGQSDSFTFVSTDTPSTLAGSSGGFPIGDSVAYPGTINFSSASPNEQFTVQSVPEPSSLSLLVVGSVGWLVSVKRKFRA